jgi:anti-sigma factor RsiW
MIDEQLEFAISQYADGTLPPSQRAALEARLGTSPALMAMLDEYREFGGAFRDASPALPAINWERLAVHLSDAVAQSDVQDDDHVRGYESPWAMPRVMRMASLAVAACLALAIGISFERRAKPAAAPVGPSEIAVAGPAADAPAGAVVEQIAVGPSPAVAMDDSTFRYGDSGVVSQPARVVIATSDAPVQDTPTTPY